MKITAAVMIKESMGLHEACNALNQLEGTKIHRVQDVSFDKGETVVFLRRPSLMESIKLALMPKAMKREANHPAFAVFKAIAVNNGIAASSTLLKNVKDAIEGGDGEGLREALMRVQLSPSNREHRDLF